MHPRLVNTVIRHTRIKILDIEITRLPTTIENLNGYAALQGVVRLHGVPIGNIKIPVTGDHCTASAVCNAVLRDHSAAILRHLLDDALAASIPLSGFEIANLFKVPHPT